MTGATTGPERDELTRRVAEGTLGAATRCSEQDIEGSRAMAPAGKEREADIERAWELMEKLRFCMFSTWNGDKLRSRPMGAFVRRQEGVIYFLTDVRAHKDEEIREFPKICLAFADPRGQKYVSVSGRAEVVSDRQEIRELWGIQAKGWWDSPEDPNIRLIRVCPIDAEYWDSPSATVVYAYGYAKAALTGEPPKMGENKKVAF